MQKIKNKWNETGQGRYPEWDYFDAMDNILGHKPATQPPVVIDSGNYLDDQKSQWSPEILENPLSNRSVSPFDDDASTSVSTKWSASSWLNQSDQLSQAKITSKPTNTKRKRLKFDVVGELIDKFIGMQEKIEEMMLDF